MTGHPLDVTMEDGLCRLRFARPGEGNTITPALVEAFGAALARCADPHGGVPVVVVEGSPEVFCAGGDFKAVAASDAVEDPGPLFDLWRRLSNGPFVSVALVRGRANAGGLGFVAACDIVLADPSASFALSEMLFGLFPACVLPFLIRRLGERKAHVLTLSTQPMSAAEALASGLVDGLDDPLERLERRYLQRLRLLSRPAIVRYKAHMAEWDGWLGERREAAVRANREMFSDPRVRADIRRYVTEGLFPWEHGEGSR